MCALLLTPIVVSFLSVAGAQMMGSENFQMESDSVNVGGGHATSENFTMEDTTGEVATGPSTSESFELRAGFQQMQQILISMSEPESVVMSPSIPGVAGGFSNGSTSVTVITDNPAGYELRIASESEPALQATEGSETIGDYAPSGDSDFSFSTEDTDAHMGYTVVSDHAVDRFLNDGENCSTGSLNTSDNCWDGLSTAPATIVGTANANHPDGTLTEVYFRVGVGGDVVQAPGTYVATTTVTAVPL